MVNEDSSVYFSDGIRLICFNTDDNTVKWESDVGECYTTPNVYCEVILTPLVDRLIAVAKSGEEIEWESERIGLISSPPIVLDDSVYITTLGGLHKIRPSNGQITNSLSVDTQLQGICSDGENIFCSVGGAQSGALIRIGPQDLTKEWAANRSAHVKSEPVFEDGRVYCTTDSGEALAVDANDGSTIWSKQVVDSRAPSPLVLEDLVVIASGNGDKTVALERSTGEPRWQLTTGPVLSPPAADKDAIYIGSMNKGLYRVSQDGDVLDQMSKPNVGSPMCLTSAGILFKSRWPDEKAFIV